MRHPSAGQPQDVVYVLSQLEELQTRLGGRLDALIRHEADLSIRAERQALRTAGVAVAVAVATISALAWACIWHS